MGCSPRQVALIFASHLVSELRQLAGPQAPDEGIHPAGPPLQAVEQVPEGVSVAQARVGGPQPILVICRKAGQVRQDLQNIHTAEAAVVVADVLVGLVLSKRHRRSSSADGALDSASATAERYGLRDGEDWKRAEGKATGLGGAGQRHFFPAQPAGILLLSFIFNFFLSFFLFI